MRGIIRVNKANTTISISRNIGQPNPSTFGQSVTFTVNVNSFAPIASAAVVGAPTGTVTIRSNGTPIVSASISVVPGTSNLQSRAVIGVTGLPVGNNQVIDAVYNNDANFNGSTATTTVTHSVIKATPTASLTNPTNPSTFGQQVTFTATVSGPAAAAAAPSGNVTFRNGVNPLATVALNTSGQPAGQAVATHSVSNLAVGTHDIRADYVGDGNFNLLNDTVLSPGQQLVNKANPTVAVSSNAPTGAFATQTVTFTAALSAPLGTPTGTVTFRDNGTPIPGDVALVAGAANKAVSNLTGGSHNISAVYNPGADPNFNTNTGNLNTNPQVIRDFSVSATPNPLSGTSGQARTFNGTLTSLGGYGPRTVNLSCGSGAPVTCTPAPSSVSVPSGGTANFSVNVSSLAAPGT
ncbi:MAG: Ig-like domain-containing protein, partial [Acidobacteriales bacterium]|nr:Ig-like domain-containing protein [Terriglobales bacterium]